MWWVAGHALVCQSDTAFLFDVQFCSVMSETGTRQIITGQATSGERVCGGVAN